MVELKGQQLIVTGKIDFTNANQVFEQGKQYLLSCQSVDLSALEQGNTLTLAVLVQWLRLAPQLRFEHIPEKMMKIIQSCHLENIIKKASLRCLFYYVF